MISIVEHELVCDIFFSDYFRTVLKKHKDNEKAARICRDEIWFK